MARRVEANGVRFAYRRFGKASGVPIVFNQHYLGTMNYWDPAVTDGLARDREVILFNNAEVSPAQIEAMDKWGVQQEGSYGYLKTITQPTLVVNGSNDVIMPTVSLRENIMRSYKTRSRDVERPRWRLTDRGPFRQGLREVGVVENRHVVLDFAWIRNEPELPQAVTELMQRGAKLLIPCGTSASVAAKHQVSAIPILFINVGNPIGVGLVASLSRPGGNVTGFSDMHADLSGKYVQFAVEFGKPQATVNYLWYTEWADGQYRLQATERAAQSLGVNLRSRGIGDISEANDVMAAMKTDGAVTLIVQSSPFMFRHRRRIIDSAMDNGLATIYAFPQGQGTAH
jgi:ABC transporter substrate binding protein